MNQGVRCGIALIFGLLLGVGALFLVAFLPFPPEQKINALFGIEKKRIVGFLPYWLLAKATNPYGKTLTNITYFGLALDNDGSVVKLTNPQEEDPGWTTLKGDGFTKKRKEASTHLQTLSLLVHTADEATISALLENPEKHAQNLVSDIAPLMKQYGFGELNLDIESFVDATQGAQQQFTSFVKTVKKEMDAKKLGILTVEIPVRSLFYPLITDPVALGKIADYVVVMAYDYHYLGSYISGPVAPVGGAGEVREMDVTTTLDRAIKQIPKEKILLGIPLYGYQWETLNTLPMQPVIPGSGATASNKRIEELLKTCTGCTKTIDPVSLEPIITSPSGDVVTQIYIEDSQSLAKKIDLAKKYDIGGIALWALGYESNDMLGPLTSYKRSFRFR